MSKPRSVSSPYSGTGSKADMNGIRFNVRTYLRSTYIADPRALNGEVKVIKPADPEKLEEYRKSKLRRGRY